jgi:rhamnosyltransferase
MDFWSFYGTGIKYFLQQKLFRVQLTNADSQIYRMKIDCVIVCYKPDVVNLANICKALLTNSVNVILVDNSEVSYIAEMSNSLGVELIRLNENLGIAKAQNIGIRLAIENKAEIITFFDQDSEIENDFINNLIGPLKRNRPMVVSPVFFDRKYGFRFPSYKLNRFGLLKEIENRPNETAYDVDVIISSGSAATKEVFEIVGLMNEEYFIDFVDTEWSLRCKNKGVPIKVVPSAIMKHSIGDKSIDLKFMRIFIHSPLRSYYKVRNSFLFYRCRHVPFLFGMKEIVSALTHNFLAIFVVGHRWDYVRNYFEAIRDGLVGRKGKKYNKNIK